MEVGRSQFLFPFPSPNVQETKEEMEKRHVPTIFCKRLVRALTNDVGREISRLFSFLNRSHCAWLCGGQAGGKRETGLAWQKKYV